MSNNMNSTIALAATKLRLRAECDEESVSDELILEVAKLYYSTHGHLPSHWAKYMESVLSNSKD